MRVLSELLLLGMLCGAARGQAPVVLRRVPAGGTWDVVARLAGQNAAAAAQDGRFVWTTRQRLEVVFENHADASQSVRMVSEPGPNDDCYARIERMTASALVVSCIGEKWATYENHEYLYDPQSRKLLRRFAHMPFGAAAAREDGVILRQGADEVKAFLRVGVDEGGEPHMAGPAAAPAEGDAEAAFGQFRLARRKNRYGSEYTVIAEGGRIYELPQSDLATWEAARPDDVKSFLHPDKAERNEEIGPHQWAGGNLWFGKTFYNSEGMTGVGGFGYFDTSRRGFRLYAPPEIQRCSVSAILVEADAVWLTLDRRGEYNNYPGGLLRWDWQSRRVREFPLDEIGVTIARIGRTMCVGTTEGLAIVRGDRLTSYLVDRGADGRWEIAERNRSQ
jgi:hypothetical protein